MKSKIIFTIAIAALFLNIACDEKYEIKEYEYAYYEPIETNFFAGDTDSSIYYNYEPDVEFSIQYMQNGYFEYTHTFDINEDGRDDFAIEVEGYRDSIKSNSNYWRTINIHSIMDYQIADGYVTVTESGVHIYYQSSFGGPIALQYGDTLTNHYYSGYYNEKFQLIETGYQYETNSYDTCCGNWNTWGEDRHIAFQKSDSISIIGWMRLEFMKDSETIKLKDCAIRKFKTEKY